MEDRGHSFGEAEVLLSVAEPPLQLPKTFTPCSGNIPMHGRRLWKPISTVQRSQPTPSMLCATGTASVLGWMRVTSPAKAYSPRGATKGIALIEGYTP